MGFPETDYTVVESDPGDRRPSIEKAGINVGNITVIVRFFTFDGFPAQPTINITGVDPAEGYIIFKNVLAKFNLVHLIFLFSGTS